MDEKEMLRVVRLCRRYDRLMQKAIMRLLDKFGADVAVSVVSNMSTTMLAQAITMIDAKGGNVDQFVSILMHETKNKFDAAASAVKTERVLTNMMQAPNLTCRPLH